jgi:hypothetical protein
VSDYHSDRSRISNSQLSRLKESPKQYYAEYVLNKRSEATPAMLRGSMVHTLVLEPEKFPSLYVVMPDFSKDEENVTDKGVRSTSSATKYVKQAQENWRAKHTGRIELDAAEYAICNRVFSAIQERPDLADLLAKSEKEQVFEGEICGVECKGRIDFIGSMIGDLKTMVSASQRHVMRTLNDDELQYGFKLAFYRELVRQNIGDLPVAILAVEKSGDFDRCLYRIPGVLLDNYFELVEAVLGQYKFAIDNDVWYGVDSGMDIVDLPIPAYLLKTELSFGSQTEPQEILDEEPEF